MRASRPAIALILVALVATPATGRATPDPRPPDLAALVDPLVGTGAATVVGSDPANINTFPGADVPFGMMQWSPDTAPHRQPGGGYSYADSRISGFSLTHLSGPGCPIYGDVPILPTVGAIGASPRSATQRFAHSDEQASPGRYAVTFPMSGIGVDLGVTTRTGLGRFTFPRSASANLLFKADGSAAGVDTNHIRVVGDREVTGSVMSGHFCQTPSRAYTLYFAVQFNRPIARSGTWRGSTVTPDARICAGTRGSACGAWVSFDTRTDTTVLAKVGISFVSVAGARTNLRAEDRGWNVTTVQRNAHAAWNGALRHITVTGGTAGDQRTFYTALYHSLLHPNVFSDADGRYVGFDDLIHRSLPGHAQYANISDWDIYRCAVPLLALVAPRQTSDMMQSLVNDAAQGGWLPKIPIANIYTDEMNGDSPDAVLASAYAFGATDFDTTAALKAMVHGATRTGTGQGWAPERQDLPEYLARGWVHAGSRDLTSSDYTVGGSETLEYAIDDFAIARFAQAIGDQATAERFARRGANWQHLFNPATRYLSARRADGSFPSGPAFQRSKHSGIGQDGWEEGNSIQYSWSVPQDLRGLFDRMGGNDVVVRRLDTYFSQLNAGRYQPYEWAGNEPNLGTPWEYDYAGAPYRTQDVVRRIALQLYHPTPDGIPGNDDLGAMSSWFVWAAIGMYPETPGAEHVVLASPLFTSVTVALPSGHRLVIRAPAASHANRYVQAAALDGLRYSRPWLPASVLHRGGVLDLTLASTANTTWGSRPGAAPPSYPAAEAASSWMNGMLLLP